MINPCQPELFSRMILSAGIVMELVYSSEVNDGGNVSFDWVVLGTLSRLLALLTPQQTVTVVHFPFRLTCLSCSATSETNLIAEIHGCVDCSSLDACGVCGGNEGCSGCIDSAACNYDAAALVDDSSCDYDCGGCLDVSATDFLDSDVCQSGELGHSLH